jgi:peptide-methionine (S)-S-oxide reductase
LEAVFELLEGVERVESGYAGGSEPSPTYEQVCAGTTGHAEVVQVTFDPRVITYGDVLEVFFATHDPTTLNRQGPDVGTQYRSAIFYHSEDQRETAQSLIAELNQSGIFPGPIVTEVAELVEFHPAESYHQEFFRNNPNQPYCRFLIDPKVAKFRQKFAARLKADPPGS